MVVGFVSSTKGRLGGPPSVATCEVASIPRDHEKARRSEALLGDSIEQA